MTRGRHVTGPALRLRSRACAGACHGAALLVAVAFGGCGGREAQPAPSTTLAIVHVAVWDGRADTARADRTVLVDGRHIVAEGPSDSTAVPEGVRRVDGTGRWLIPGLWDMHVHTVTPAGGETLPLYVANGVTGVRDMAGDIDTLRTWQAEIAAHARIGPRMVVSGPYLEGGDNVVAHLLVATPEDAGPAVDSLIRLGVDFVKVHSQLDRARYFAIASAARARGITFAGHVPPTVSAVEASDSGQASIEHLQGIPVPCTPEDSVRLAPRYPLQAALGRCSSADLAPILRRLADNGTWVVPTLVAQVQLARWPRSDVPGDADARYVPAALRDFVASIFPMPEGIPPGADSVGLAILDKRAQVVGMLHRAGVGVMPGTDAPLRNSAPGFGLHRELAWMVRAGMTPAEVLRAATLDPARFFGATDTLGTVEPGKLADLVLLDADPLVDVANAARITLVVADGVPYQPGPLLERAEAAGR